MLLIGWFYLSKSKRKSKIVTCAMQKKENHRLTKAFNRINTELV
jgi:hypothetical protein